MSVWAWFIKRYCAHQWETVSTTDIGIGRVSMPERTVGTLHVFHERCTICGTNNIKKFRI